MAQDKSNNGGEGEANPTGLDGASSTELVRMVQGGEERALVVLFGRYRPIMRRWAAGRLPGWAREMVDTEDLVQDALIGTLRNIHSFAPRHAGAFGAYLRQALKNRVRDEVRKANVRPQRVEMSEDYPDGGASPLENAIGSEAMLRYESALDRLSETDREMVLARIEMGLSYSEIAEMSDKSGADAARMAVTRALVRMAREMGHE